MLFRAGIVAISAAILSFSTASTIAEQPVKTINIEAKRFSFSPAEITLKKGETVKLSLVSDDVAHSLVIKELHVNAPIVKGHPTEVLVTPEQVGDFKGACGRFCGSGHGSMHLVVHVTDK